MIYIERAIAGYLHLVDTEAGIERDELSGETGPAPALVRIPGERMIALPDAVFMRRIEETGLAERMRREDPARWERVLELGVGLLGSDKAHITRAGFARAELARREPDPVKVREARPA